MRVWLWAVVWLFIWTSNYRVIKHTTRNTKHSKHNQTCNKKPYKPYVTSVVWVCVMWS